MKKLILAAAALLLTGCASDPTVTSDSAPQPSGPVGGVIAATSGVNGGTASYTIQIPIPPGRNDIAPSLQLDYSSNDGDDLLGMGWGIDTPEAVHRCPATLAMDGYSAGVRYARTDRLCLDGAHLVLTSGSYGRSGSTYEKELADGAQVSLMGDIDSPASYLVVTHVDGNKGYFKTAWAAAGSTAPLYWYMTRYVDKEGGTIEYSYDRSQPGEMLLSEIRYTGHEVAGVDTPGTRYVRFTYEARPDMSSSFLAGGEVRQTRRLAGIVVGMDADKPGAPARETREFSFSYTVSAATGRSLLAAVHECIVDADGAKQWLPDTRFTWEAERLHFAPPVAYAIPNQESDLQPQQLLDATLVMRSPYITPGDFDGDGRRELLYYRPGVGAHLYFLKPDGSLRQDVDVSKFFQSPPEVLFHSAAADVDNDGASDLPGNVGGHLGFISWTGAGMGQPVVTDIPYSEQMALSYVTGGRQPDVIQVEPVSAGSSDAGLYLYRNLGSRPGDLHFGKRQLVYALKGHKSGSVTRHQGFFVAGDVDGNGLTDMFIVSGSHLDTVILSRQDADGSWHFDAVSPASIGMPDRPLDEHTYFADINGDGLFDIVYSDGTPRTWRYQLNRGGRFDPAVDTGVADERSLKAGVTSTFATDIDDDGMDELLYPDKMLVPYCLGAKRQTSDGKFVGHYQCADDPAGMDTGWDDLSIYQFAVLKFRQGPDGRLTPVVVHDADIVAQANLVGSGDLQGDGLTDVFSPFSSWYGDGGFRGDDGQHSPCPPRYGCGLHVSSHVAAGHQDGADSAQDFMTAAVDGLGARAFWDYYPISSTKAGFYSVVPVGSPARYIDEDDYYFTSSMYLVGAFGRSSGAGDGYQAFSLQYGDERYGTSGRGLRGFRYEVEHDLSDKYRKISLYDQRFPLDGRLLAEWKVSEDTLDDGLQKGVAPPDHRYAQSDSWDCLAPKGYAAGGLHCQDSGGPTFSYLLRHKLYHDYDNKLDEWTDVDSSYDYDQDGFEIHRRVKTVSSKKVETTDVTYRYAPDQASPWVTGRVMQEKTSNTVDPIATAKDAPAHSQTDEDDTYEYDDRGRDRKVIQVGPDPYVETRALSYQEDPAAADYGRLDAISVTRAAKQDAPPDFLRNLHIAYDPQGYFITSVSALDLDPETTETDPVTGKILHQSKQGVTEEFRYDILGRTVHYARNEKGKDPVVWDAVYASCAVKKCMIKDAVYMVTETVNGQFTAMTYYDKRGEKLNHPTNSFIKDDE